MPLPSEEDIEAIGQTLETFARDSAEHYQAQQRLLQRIPYLLGGLQRLLSDCEEAKNGLHKYKKLAQAAKAQVRSISYSPFSSWNLMIGISDLVQEGEPFVLVLVDGDNYVFREELIRAGEDGGITAGGRLSDAIQNLLDGLPDKAEMNCPRDTVASAFR